MLQCIFNVFLLFSYVLLPPLHTPFHLSGLKFLRLLLGLGLCCLSTTNRKKKCKTQTLLEPISTHTNESLTTMSFSILRSQSHFLRIEVQPTIPLLQCDFCSTSFRQRPFRRVLKPLELPQVRHRCCTHRGHRCHRLRLLRLQFVGNR